MLKRLFGKKKTKPAKPPQTSPVACPNCRVRPVALDTATGKYFDYCTKACASQAKGPNSNQRSGQSMCNHCKRRPKYSEGGKEHPYCGLRCAGLAKGTPTLRHTRSTMPRITSLDPTCHTPGCSLPVFVPPDGVPGEYCTITHKQWGERGCISCRVAGMNGKTILCQNCYDDAAFAGPVLIKVPEDHENYTSVESQFKESWRHKTKCPEVRAVYKIINTETSTKTYDEYLDGVEARGNFSAMGKSPGNENRRWHGTRRTCNIGDKVVTDFCQDPNCSLCSIIKTSFDIKFFKGATGWGRFGRGIYTSSTSSKSNDYSKNDGVTSDWKALLLNKVVVGTGKKMTRDDATLTKAPLGYDSVLAEVVPGGSLNYDEIVVYHNDAIRPSYLVMYESA